MVTRQKVSAVLRKAGFVAAKWHASARVRGWGDWSSGVRVRTDYQDRISVDWVFGGSWRRDVTDQEVADKLSKIEKALGAAGIRTAMDERGTAIVVVNEDA